jgi:type I restriction enzyme, S subunit
MSPLPPGWELRRLDDIADVRLGRQRSPKNHSGTQMRPYLRAANVDWTGLTLSDVKEMNFTDDEMAIYRLQPGDIVLGEASGSPGEVGKPGLWTGEIADCAFQNTLIRVRSRGPDPRYLLQYFRHLARSRAFADESRGVGIHHIGRAKLAAWLIPVPPLDEQRRIVDILDDHLSRLDAAARGLHLCEARLGALEQSVLSGAYRSGEVVPLGEVTSIQGGIQKQPKRAPRSNAYPFLRVANVTSRGLNLADVHSVELFVGELGKLRLRTGDLLVVEGNGSANQIGRAALWDGSIEDCVHQNHLIRVRALPGLLPAFLEAVWNSPQNRGRLTDLASSSSGLHTLTVAKLKSLAIPVPDSGRQQDVIQLTVEARLARNRIEVAIARGIVRTDQLRRSLRHAAFSGRLTTQGTIHSVKEVAGV